MEFILSQFLLNSYFRHTIPTDYILIISQGYYTEFPSGNSPSLSWVEFAAAESFYSQPFCHLLTPDYLKIIPVLEPLSSYSDFSLCLCYCSRHTQTETVSFKPKVLSPITYRFQILFLTKCSFIWHWLRLRPSTMG